MLNNGVRAYPLTGLGAEQTQEIRQYPILASGRDLPDEDTLYGFETEGAFERWIASTPHADNVRRARGDIEATKSYERRDNTPEIERQREISEQFVRDVHDLSIETGLPANSVELLQRAVDEKNPLPGTDPLFLFEHINFGGQMYPVWGWSGSFGSWWSNFHDRASSYIAISTLVGIMCEHSWFRGRWLWYFGPVWWSTNLHPLGFGDVASSAWMYPG